MDLWCLCGSLVSLWISGVCVVLWSLRGSLVSSWFSGVCIGSCLGYLVSVRSSGGTLWFSGVSTVLWCLHGSLVSLRFSGLFLMDVDSGLRRHRSLVSLSLSLSLSLEAAAFHQNPVKTKVTNTSFSPVRPEPCGWWPASLSRDRAPAYVNNDLEVIVP